MKATPLLTTFQSEEQKPLEEFFQAKGLKAKNEMLDDVSPLLFAPRNICF